MYPPLLRVDLKIDLRTDTYEMFVVFIFVFLIFFHKSIFCGYPFELQREVDSILQFKWVSTAYAFIMKGTKSALAVI